MTNNVYTLYNNLSNRYGDVFCYASDGLAVARVQPLLVRDKVLRENELCRIGRIDIETGVLESFPPVRIAWTVEPLPVTPPSVTPPSVASAPVASAPVASAPVASAPVTD